MNGSCEINKKPKGWQALLTSWYFWKPFIGFTVGSLAGLIYYYYVLSGSGSSPITSGPVSNALFGGMIGFFIVKRPCSSC